MSKKLNGCSLILPFIVGIVLGVAAKLVDVPFITADLPIFDDIMGRFGIWVWAGALTAVLSRTSLLAAVRSFAFFAGMLIAYYSYTVLFLHFFPKSQMILWGGIAMATPFCGYLMWHVHKKKYYANFIASLPFIIFFTEWYLTAFQNQYWSAGDKVWLLVAYLCMTFSLLLAVPTNKKRLLGVFYGSVISIILICLIQAGIMFNLYEKLLNVSF